MSGDDPTSNLPPEAAKTTQPTITAVFELLREIKQSVDANNARLDEMESRHARDFANLNARIDALTQEVRDGFDRLAAIIERNREHAEADYVKFNRRLRDLESKVS